MADACDTCQTEPVQFIVGNASTGEQQFLGVACFARFGLEFAKAVLPAQEIAAQLGPMFVNLSTASDQELENPPPKRARKSKAAKEEPAQGQAGGPAEVPPAAANE